MNLKLNSQGTYDIFFIGYIYCYPLNEDELIINIKTGYDVKRVNIILGDPFAAGILGGGEHWDGKKEAIVFKKRLKNQQ